MHGSICDISDAGLILHLLEELTARVAVFQLGLNPGDPDVKSSSVYMVEL